MKKYILTFGCLTLAAFMSQALELTVTPGSLQSEMPALVNTQDKSLILRGSANVTDLALLKHLSRSVTTLDMSGLRIDPYIYKDGDYYGIKNFEAGEIPPYMLTGSAVTVFKFPEAVTKIGESAFAGSMLRTMNVPASVTSVGDYAFSDCIRLSGIRFVSVPEFGKGVLKGCPSLTTVDFVEAIPDIPESMFDGCASYAAAPSEDIVSIGAYAYRGTAVEKLDLFKVEKLGDYCFADMPLLAEVNIDLSHEPEMGKGVFYNDSTIGILPNWEGVLPALSLAYTAGKQKRSFSFPVIEEAALANNTEIEYVALSSSVKEIKAHAFRNLSSLTQVDVNELGSDMPEVDPLAFSGLENSEGRYDIILNVAKDTNDTWQAHPVWGLFDIRNMNTGVGGAVEGTALNITITRNAGTVDIMASQPIDYAGIFSIDGTVLHESRPGVERHGVNGLDDYEVLLVKVVSGGKQKILKLR